MKRPLWLIPAALALALAGCTSTTGGTPVPGDSQATELPTTSGGPQTTTSSDTPAVQPCTLLSDSAAHSLGAAGTPKQKNFTGISSCSWRVEKATAADSYLLDIAFFSDRGVKDIGGHDKKPVRVGHHDAVQSLGAEDTGCVVTFGITDTSRVDVRAIGGDSASLCRPALDTATAIEPNLP